MRQYTAPVLTEHGAMAPEMEIGEVANGAVAPLAEKLAMLRHLTAVMPATNDMISAGTGAGTTKYAKEAAIGKPPQNSSRFLKIHQDGLNHHDQERSAILRRLETLRFDCFRHRHRRCRMALPLDPNDVGISKCAQLLTRTYSYAQPFWFSPFARR